MAAKLPAYPKGSLAYWEDLIPQCRASHDFNTDLTPEVQTDKHLVKAMPCTDCKRVLIVSTFYVPAWNPRCASCKGETNGRREKGSVGQPQKGRTRPEHAADLAKVLINPTFEKALCPVHPDDEAHVMELKSVSHNKNCGPTVVQFVKGEPTYVQVAPGEVVLHQCLKCKATVSYSTAVTVQFKRCNEPDLDSNKHTMGMARWLGTRDEIVEEVEEDDESE